MDPAYPFGAPVFRRILLKLSGESFCRPGEGGISVEEVSRIARQAARVASRGVELSIVVGGGNILRGASLRGSDVIQEATAHYMGMTATVINGLALQDALEGMGCETRLMTTIKMDEVAEPFIRRRALSHLARGRVIILATGTGSPFVTTDTAAALRGKELEVEVLLKATRVDGIYSADPEKNPHAVRYEHLTPDQVMRGRPQGHGHDRDRHVPRQLLADPRLQLQEGRQHRTGHRRRAHRHLGLNLAEAEALRSELGRSLQQSVTGSRKRVGRNPVCVPERWHESWKTILDDGMSRRLRNRLTPGDCPLDAISCLRSTDYRLPECLARLPSSCPAEAIPLCEVSHAHRRDRI